MAEEYWTQNTSGLFAKKKFETAIWDAAYRCHLDGTLTRRIYEVSAVPYDPAEEETDETAHTELLVDEGEEWENKMRKTVLSLGQARSDESAHLKNPEKSDTIWLNLL